MTGLQVEVGTSATDFEHLPHEINGFRCCRYYQLVGLDIPQYRFMPSISTNWSGETVFPFDLDIFEESFVIVP